MEKVGDSMNDPIACLKIAACICGKDGVISEIEERTLHQCLLQRFPNISTEQFDKALDEFFDSSEQIEDYLALIEDPDLRRFTLKLAEESASADGLNIKENIALEKTYLIWGVKAHV